jgi:hypothetical protein
VKVLRVSFWRFVRDRRETAVSAARRNHAIPILTFFFPRHMIYISTLAVVVRSGRNRNLHSNYHTMTFLDLPRITLSYSFLSPCRRLVRRAAYMPGYQDRHRHRLLSDRIDGIVCVREAGSRLARGAWGEQVATCCVE